MFFCSQMDLIHRKYLQTSLVNTTAQLRCLLWIVVPTPSLSYQNLSTLTGCFGTGNRSGCGLVSFQGARSTSAAWYKYFALSSYVSPSLLSDLYRPKTTLVSGMASGLSKWNAPRPMICLALAFNIPNICNPSLAQVAVNLLLSL